jgi:hypothetical protein
LFLWGKDGFICKKSVIDKNNATLKGKQRDNVNKARPPFPTTFSCCSKISSPRQPYGDVKSAGGGDCE